MPLPRKDPPDPEKDKAYAAWLRTELVNHVPVLAEYADPPIPWQWWRGELYLAGFGSRESAEEYGKMSGWLTT